MSYIILITLLSTHIANYKEHFIDIGVNFAITFALKRLLKSFGEDTKSEFIGLGGYSLTCKEFFEYLKAVKDSGTASPSGEEIKGLFPWLFEVIKEGVTNKQ